MISTDNTALGIRGLFVLDDIIDFDHFRIKPGRIRGYCPDSFESFFLCFLLASCESYGPEKYRNTKAR